TISTFVAEGLSSGQPSVVITSTEARAPLVDALRACKIDVDRQQATGELTLVDTREMLSFFMANGVVQAERFLASATRALDRVRYGRPYATARVSSDLVDVLWKDGLPIAALQLEMLWNKLATTRSFSLVCGYARARFQKAFVNEIYGQHTHFVD